MTLLCFCDVSGLRHRTAVISCHEINQTRMKPFLTYVDHIIKTSGSAIAEGPRDVLVSRNSATTKYRYRVALFA